LFIRCDNDELELEIHVSKGTYIRTIIDDLGEMLGCGAHITMLRRLEVANYPQEKMVTLDHLQALLEQANDDEIEPSVYLDPLLLPMDTAVSDFPEANITDEMAVGALHGNPVTLAGFSEGTLVRMTVGDSQRFIGVGIVDSQLRVQPKRLVVSND